MPLGKRTAKITKFYIEARTIGVFIEYSNMLFVIVLQKKMAQRAKFRQKCKFRLTVLYRAEFATPLLKVTLHLPRRHSYPAACLSCLRPACSC